MVEVVGGGRATTARSRRRLFKLPHLRSATSGDWAQLLRFGLVGASGYVINLVVFSLFIAGGVGHQLAAIAAFVVAWCRNFLLNRQWTFRQRTVSRLRQGSRYLVVSLIGLGVNLALLEILVRAGNPELPSQAIAIAAVTPLSFLLSRRWTFR